MNIADIFGYTQNKGKFKKLPESCAILNGKMDSIVKSLRGKMEGTGERFLRIMMKLSIIKLAVAMTTLIVMTVLFFAHLHTFDTITLQFSKWASTPIISFIVLIIALKFAAISIGLTLTIMSVKKVTFESMRLRLMEYCKLRLGVLIRKKAYFQRV